MIIDGIFMNKDGKIILSNKAAEELANEIAYCATEAKDHGYSGYVQLFYKKDDLVTKESITLVILPG